MENLNDISDGLRNMEKEFKESIEPYRADLWRYCYKLTRSPWDAEDLVQETLLRSLSLLTKLYQPIKTKSYLFKIATNLWIDQWRRNKNNHQDSEEHLLEMRSDLDRDLMENLEILIQQLTPNQYVALILTDAFQFKGKEVAEILGTTEGAIHTNVSRARDLLRKYNGKLLDKELPKIKNLQANGTIAILLEGFRKKDPEMIASILAEHVVTDITHAGIELGKAETKKNSLKDWHEIVQGQHEIVSEYRELWGRPVVVELEKKEDNQLYLNNIHYIEIDDDKISYWKFYCFSWDLMNLAAKELGVNLNAKYFYHIF
ncbi:MAG: sigma-70 family RNA polymerase sigma factor [Heyndrickxia sp.]